MLKLDNKINFNEYTAEDVYVNSGKLKKNIENTLKDLTSIIDKTTEDNFVKLYIGLSGGIVRPIICSSNLLKEFLETQYIIANTLSDNAMNLINKDEDSEE